MFVMAASASATMITFNTSGSGTGFGVNGVGGLVLHNNSGAAATLVFTPNMGNTSGVPTNVNFGDFVLTCATCSPQNAPNALFAHFNPFQFELVITDVTDGNARGKFVGNSNGGDIYYNISPINLNWAPLKLGTGTNNASFGNFGLTSFTTTNFSGIVGPNSGNPPGTTTIQGFIDSASSEASGVPEPATLGLVGAALFGVGLLSRRKIVQE